MPKTVLAIPKGAITAEIDLIAPSSTEAGRVFVVFCDAEGSIVQEITVEGDIWPARAVFGAGRVGGGGGDTRGDHDFVTGGPGGVGGYPVRSIRYIDPKP